MIIDSNTAASALPKTAAEAIDLCTNTLIKITDIDPRTQGFPHSYDQDLRTAVGVLSTICGAHSLDTLPFDRLLAFSVTGVHPWCRENVQAALILIERIKRLPQQPLQGDDGEWLTATSKADMANRLGNVGTKKAVSILKKYGLKMSGNRQLWTVRLDIMPKNIRQKLERAK